MDAKKICGGIVTYNPDPTLFVKVLKALAFQVGRIYVWDNGSDNLDYIRKICGEYNVILLTLKKNMGIAYGLNKICEKAVTEGYNWILTLDHDTIISPNYVANIDLNIGLPIGIICPRVRYVGLDHITEKNLNRYKHVEACMTSGSIMSLKVWEQVGKFNDWLFIDSVDNEICYKIRQNKYEIIEDNKLMIIHNLGKPIKKSLFGYKYIDYQYPAFRIYYIVRNRIYLTKKYWRLNGLRFIGASLKILFNTFLSTIGDSEKKRKYREGLKDGILK